MIGKGKIKEVKNQETVCVCVRERDRGKSQELEVGKKEWKKKKKTCLLWEWDRLKEVEEGFWFKKQKGGKKLVWSTYK